MVIFPPMQDSETKTPNSRNLAASLMLYSFIVLLTTVLLLKRNAAETSTARWDFQAFYLGAEMVGHGEGSELYSLDSQASAQRRYVDTTRQVTSPDRPFIYPAAIVLFFVPFMKAPMWLAYSLWTAASLLLLLASLRLLQKVLPLPQGNRPFLAAILLAPVYLCLLKGQVSILIFFFFVLGFFLFMRGRLLLAGCALGLAALKFQLILGLLAVLALRGLWIVVAGSGLSAAMVAGISVLITGWRAALQYPVFLRQVAYRSDVAYTPVTVNLRGMLWLFTRHEPAVWLVALLSCAVIIAAAIAWKDASSGFALAMIASVLVSYHAHLEELTLLLLPFAVLVARLRWNWVLIGATVLVFVAGYVTLLIPVDIWFAMLTMGLLIVGLWRTRATTESALMKVASN